MDKKWVIYLHKCRTTQKCYIGQTCQEPEQRWGNNGYKYTKKNNLKFYNAIKKYGWDNFDHYILDECNDLQTAYKLEQYYINKFDSYKNGYNSTLGGQGSKGKKMSLKNREKIIIANKSKPSWIKYVPKEKTPMYGKHHTEETKEKIGNANRGRVISQEGREKMRQAKLGKKGMKRTLETKEKLRNRKLGKLNPMFGKHTNNRDDSKIPIIQMDLNGNEIAEFESIRFAEKTLNIWGINRAIKTKIKAGGYLWKKKNSN